MNKDYSIVGWRGRVILEDKILGELLGEVKECDAGGLILEVFGKDPNFVSTQFIPWIQIKRIIKA